MITGLEFIQLSNRWAGLAGGHGGGEAVWRTSICRAYYGAFHLAQDFLTEITVRIPIRNAHDFVYKALMHSGDANLEKAGRMLGDLREYRNDADYDLLDSEHGRQELARICHRNAEEILALLKRGGSANRIVIRSKIVSWMKLIGHQE